MCSLSQIYMSDASLLHEAVCTQFTSKPWKWRQTINFPQRERWHLNWQLTYAWLKINSEPRCSKFSPFEFWVNMTLIFCGASNQTAASYDAGELIQERTTWNQWLPFHGVRNIFPLATQHYLRLLTVYWTPRLSEWLWHQVSTAGRSWSLACIADALNGTKGIVQVFWIGVVWGTRPKSLY